MANSNNWGEIYNSTWWGDEDWSANSLKIDSAPPGFAEQNLLLGSEELNKAQDGQWIQRLISSVTADDEVAPIGGETTAEQVAFTANKQSRIEQLVTLVAGTQYTFSVWAKATGASPQSFRLSYYDNTAGSGAREAETAPTSWDASTGRATMTFTAASSGTYWMRIQNASAGAAQSIYFWGAMLNEGAAAGDYIKTTFAVGPTDPPVANAQFGDNFGRVSAYYSLRQFTTAEDNNAIRVRRSSDDTEQDIGFDANGDLDSTALLAFVNEEITDDINTTTDSNADGLADGLTTHGNATYSIVTGNGHSGSAQRVDFNPSGGTLQTFAITTLPPIIGQEITISFMYRSNFTITSIGNGYSSAGTAFEDIPANTGDAIRFEAKAVWSPTGGSDGRVQPMWLRNSGEFIEISDWSVTYHTADGAVTTWYDQSGNGNNATNSTESEQPLVVSGGTLVEENGKAAIDYNSSGYLLANFSGTLTQPNSIFSVCKKNDHSGYLFDSISPSTRHAQGNSTWIYAGSVLNGAFPNADLGNQLIFTALFNGASSEAFIDGSLTATGDAGSQSLTGLTLGRYYDLTASVTPLNGTMQEFILFDSDQSSNRTGIETNINDHFDIYTP